MKWIAPLTLFWFTINSPLQAQISGDGSLGTLVNGSPNLSCDVASCIIEGGTTLGDNLFHSFTEFSILNGNSASFDNSATIQNIITRVTGGSVSQIDGIIEAINGNPNLFFLNPNGIIFGANAQLININSFVASTAHRLNFADGTSFSVADPVPLLTVSIPTALEFVQTPAGIQVQGAVLTVPYGQTLALVGGNITIEQNAQLIAQEGRIELGSLAGGGLVNLTPNYFSYTGVQNFGDINISQDAVVDISGDGGGNIQVQGRQVTLTEGGNLSAINLGSDSGGSITVNASESVELIGTSTNTGFPSGFQIDTQGSGGGGNIVINTRRLLVRDGAQVSAASISEGNGGNIFVNAAESIDLIGESSDLSFASGLFTNSFGDGFSGNLVINTDRLTVRDGAAASTTTFGNGKAGNLSVTASIINLIGTSADPQFASGLLTATQGARASGNLAIETGKLTLRNGAQISASTFSTGNGGEVNIHATESVVVTGKNLENSGIFAQAEVGSTGNSGNLTIATPQLIVRDEGKVSASTGGEGKGGNLVIDSDRILAESGGQISTLTTASGKAGTMRISATDSIELLGTGETGFPSGFFAQTQGSGAAGDLEIVTNNLTIQNGAKVSISGEASGNAGTLDIQANTIKLNRGFITGQTQSATGGDIQINAQTIQLLNNSFISTTAGTAAAPGDGGNITLSSDTLVGLLNSDITANSFFGRGGKIEITAQGIFGLAIRPQLTPGNDITAFSLTNPQLNGIIIIRTPDIDPTRGLVGLPENVENPDQITEACYVGGFLAAASRKLALSGRGLPANPGETLSGNWFFPDLVDEVEGMAVEGGEFSPNFANVTPHLPLVSRVSCHGF